MNGVMSVALYGACAVLAVLPSYFIFHKVYKDGTFGRLSLAAISFNATGVLVEGIVKTMLGREPDQDLLVGFFVALIIAFAVFISWHLARFHSRFAMSSGTKPCGLKDQVGCPYGAVTALQQRQRQGDPAYSLKKASS